MEEKNKVIAKVYYDPSGYASIKQTLLDARKIDKTITYDNVKDWFDKNLTKKTQLKGYISFISSKPYEEFQCDLFFMNDLEDQKYKIGVLLVDIFTKYTTIVPIKSKQESDVLAGLIEGFNNMGGKCKTLYSDDEPSSSSKYVVQYLNENNIRHLISRTHAAVAERQIRTMKDMIYKRLEHSDEKQWVDQLKYVLFTYNFKNVHNVTKFTPNDAKKKQNLIQVKLNLELMRKFNRKYPDIKVGDSVKIYKKKKLFDKQQKSLWSENNYEVTDIIESFDQKFYKTTARDKAFMRNEILKI